MTNRTNGRRGPRHFVAPPKNERLAQTIRRRLAAQEAVEAYPNPKRAAPRLKLTVRSIQGWRSPDYNESSPYHRMLEAIDAADDPWTVLAFLESAAKRVVEGLPDKSTEELASEYRALLAQDAEVEGADNGHKVSRGVDWVDRFLANRADAKVDLRLAAYALEFAYRGLTEEEVFHV